MLKPSVASCFNSLCSATFQRLGEGKLFVEPYSMSAKDSARRVVWLCARCSSQYTLYYDREKREFVLSGYHTRGRGVA